MMAEMSNLFAGVLLLVIMGGWPWAIAKGVQYLEENHGEEEVK